MGSDDRCYAPNIAYKPQWAAKPTPAGYRDETFLVPFVFFQVPATGQIVRSLPWSLDDDEAYIVQGIYFPQIGLDTGSSSNPIGQGLCRIWDPQGNPLSQGLVLGLGMWGNASIGVDGANQLLFGWGWPLEDEVVCPPGGTWLFDFQLTTTATVAAFSYVGIAAVITFYAGVFGTAGNGRTITLLDPGAPNVPLSVAIVGGVNVEVTLATDGAGVLTSSFQDVADIINNTASLRGVMNAFAAGVNTAELIPAAGPDALIDAVAAVPVDMYGCFIGVKRFKDC